MDNAFPFQFCVVFDIHCELIFKILNSFRNYLGCFCHLDLHAYVLWAIKVKDAMKWQITVRWIPVSMVAHVPMLLTTTFADVQLASQVSFTIRILSFVSFSANFVFITLCDRIVLVVTDVIMMMMILMMVVMIHHCHLWQDSLCCSVSISVLVFFMWICFSHVSVLIVYFETNCRHFVFILQVNSFSNINHLECL